MLVFTRRPGEGLIIAGEIEVKILSVDRDHVKVGIRAPRFVPVHRGEIQELIERENVSASSHPAQDADALRQMLQMLRQNKEP